MKNSKQYKVMRVSGRTDAVKTGGSMAAHIKSVLKENPEEVRFGEMLAVGASAVNQAVKAIAICNTMITSLEVQVVIKPQFRDQKVDDEMRSTMCLYVNKE